MTRKPFVFNIFALCIVCICIFRWPSVVGTLQDLAIGGGVAAMVAWFAKWQCVPPLEE